MTTDQLAALDAAATLKPCPFCGREAFTDNERGVWRIYCPQAKHETATDYYHTRAEAIAARLSEAQPSIETLKAQTIKGPKILLFSGNYFNFERPEACDWTLEDIAHGLAMTCRFAGQSRRYYSVAEHSVYVSQLVPPELAWDALMHDAAEAFICDMAKPLKELLPDYKRIEKRVEKAIAERHGLIEPMPSEIKMADIQMLRAEQVQIMRNDDDWHWTFDVPEPDVKIAALGPYEAKALFLERAAAVRAILEQSNAE